MKNKTLPIKTCAVLLTIGFLIACNPVKEQLTIPKNNLVAWCVVPFDSKQRSPQQRIDMLLELGFTKFAYDWREEHLDSMEEEWAYARKTGIDIFSVWMWFNAKRDSIGKPSPNNERIFQALRNSNLQTQIWISFNENFFEGLEEDAKLRKATEMIEYLALRADSIGCRLGLYNHGDWFGEPSNQVKIIQALPQFDLGIIYNFHHGHQQLQNFDKIVVESLPYLWCVNINGMEVDGPEILPVGQGQWEEKMIKTLFAQGYDGPIGILGHVEEEDVQLVLQRNLDGLYSLFPSESQPSE